MRFRNNNKKTFTFVLSPRVIFLMHYTCAHGSKNKRRTKNICINFKRCILELEQQRKICLCMQQLYNSHDGPWNKIVCSLFLVTYRRGKWELHNIALAIVERCKKMLRQNLSRKITQKCFLSFDLIVMPYVIFLCMWMNVLWYKYQNKSYYCWHGDRLSFGVRVSCAFTWIFS